MMLTRLRPLGLPEPPMVWRSPAMTNKIVALSE